MMSVELASRGKSVFEDRLRVGCQPEHGVSSSRGARTP